jgi:hypothetical protein|tara:strand:+ start:1860 stop:2033 length:174 start_codon:yes stop_codon:yes gene_type:complete
MGTVIIIICIVLGYMLGVLSGAYMMVNECTSKLESKLLEYEQREQLDKTRSNKTVNR